MSAHQVLPAQPGLTIQPSYSEDQIELIWAMGLASLEPNSGELIIPLSMESSLTKSQIGDLKLRLSQQIGAPTIAFADRRAQVFRITRVPALKSGENSSTHSPAQSNSSLRSSALVKASTPMNQAKFHARKAEIPRPPNAFILYRQERHPVVKSEHPEYHNNEISVILGKKWKSEPDDVKSRYKKLADDIKVKHMQDHPGYQYAPRKPSQKKRRMTARRAIELARAEGTSFMELGSDEDMSEASTLATADFYDALSSSRPKQPSQFFKGRNDSAGFILPTHNTQALHGTVDFHNNYLSSAGLPFDPINQYQLSSNIPKYIQNEQDFVNSLVDWDGIAADIALVRDASAKEMAEVETVRLGNDYLSLSEEGQQDLFEAELEKTMRYFE